MSPLSFAPISPYQNWQPPKPIPVAYAEAIKTFNQDMVQIRGLDRDGLSPDSGTLKSTDSDLRPGEVEVPELGSLHSTPEGLSLKILQAASFGAFGSCAAMREKGSREYQIDHKRGTICVLKDVGASSSVSGWGANLSDNGHFESYTIDTVNGTIADYAKREKLPFRLFNSPPLTPWVC